MQSGELLKNIGPITQARCTVDKFLVYKIVWQIAVALAYIHKKDIVYRDLKSENVLVWSTNPDDSVNVKLSDYGISSQLYPEGTSGPQGTPGFQAPEVLSGMVYDEKVDIFSFGMVLYELLTSHPPFFEMEHSIDIRRAIKQGKRPPLEDTLVMTDFPELETLMKMCWCVSPGARPSAAQIRKQTEDVPFYMLRARLKLKDSNLPVDVSDKAPVWHSHRFTDGGNRICLFVDEQQQRFHCTINIDKCSIECERADGCGYSYRCVASAAGFILALKDSTPLEVDVLRLDDDSQHSSVVSCLKAPVTLEDSFVSLQTWPIANTTECIILVGTTESSVFLFRWDSCSTSEWVLLKHLRLNEEFFPVSSLTTLINSNEVAAVCNSTIYLINMDCRTVAHNVVTGRTNPIKFVTCSGYHLWCSFDGVSIIHGYAIECPHMLLVKLQVNGQLDVGRNCAVSEHKEFDATKELNIVAIAGANDVLWVSRADSTIFLLQAETVLDGDGRVGDVLVVLRLHDGEIAKSIIVCSTSVLACTSEQLSVLQNILYCLLQNSLGTNEESPILLTPAAKKKYSVHVYDNLSVCAIRKFSNAWNALTSEEAKAISKSSCY